MPHRQKQCNVTKVNVTKVVRDGESFMEFLHEIGPINARDNSSDMNMHHHFPHSTVIQSLKLRSSHLDALTITTSTESSSTRA